MVPRGVAFVWTCQQPDAAWCWVVCCELCTCALVTEQVVSPLQGACRDCGDALAVGTVALRVVHRWRAASVGDASGAADSVSVYMTLAQSPTRWSSSSSSALCTGVCCWCRQHNVARAAGCILQPPALWHVSLSDWAACVWNALGVASRAVVVWLCREGMPAVVSRLWQRPHQVCPARVIAVSRRTCCCDTCLVLCRTLCCVLLDCLQRCSSEGRVRCRGGLSARGRGHGRRCWVGLPHSRLPVEVRQDWEYLHAQCRCQEHPCLRTYFRSAVYSMQPAISDAQLTPATTGDCRRSQLLPPSSSRGPAQLALTCQLSMLHRGPVLPLPPGGGICSCCFWSSGASEPGRSVRQPSWCFRPGHTFRVAACASGSVFVGSVSQASQLQLWPRSDWAFKPDVDDLGDSAASTTAEQLAARAGALKRCNASAGSAAAAMAAARRGQHWFDASCTCASCSCSSFR